MKPREVLAAVTGIALVAALLITASYAVPAHAAVPDAYVADVTFSPAQTVFSHPTEEVTTTVKVVAPDTWAPHFGELLVTNMAGQEPRRDWLQQTDPQVVDTGFGRWDIIFRGTVPEYAVRGYTLYYLKVRPEITFLANPGAAVPDYRELNLAQPEGWNHSVEPHVRATINGPARIDTGASLTLSGTTDCYNNGVYSPPQWQSHGPARVDIQWYDAPAGMWRSVANTYVDGPTGTWSHTILSVGSTLRWRAEVWGTWRPCRSTISNEIVVEAGSSAPPPAPVLPGAPGLTLGQVTQSTAALAWSTPGGAGSESIIGYRFGWESANGQPQPSWSQAYTLAELAGNNPFVMTNLCAGCRYSMWVEAITPQGTGARSTVPVTTVAAPDPEPPTPVPPTPPNLPPTTPTPPTVPPPPPPTIPPPAPGSGAVVNSVNNAVYPAGGGCFYHPWISTTVMSAEIDYMDLNYQVIDPNGAVADLEFESGDPLAGTPQTFAFDILFCPSFDEVGTYTIRTVATIDDYDDGNDFATTISVAPVTFTLSKPGGGVTPPPPPTPGATVSSAPRGLNAAAKRRGALLTWRAPAANGGAAVDGYRVRQVGPGPDRSYAVNGNATRLRVKGLRSGKRYVFKVRAHNAVGWSPWSRSDAVRTR